MEVLTARHDLRDILVQSQTLYLCVKVGAWMTSAPSLMLLKIAVKVSDFFSNTDKFIKCVDRLTKPVGP